MTGSRVQSRRVGVTVCQLTMHTGVRGNSKLAEMRKRQHFLLRMVNRWFAGGQSHAVLRLSGISFTSSWASPSATGLFVLFSDWFLSLPSIFVRSMYICVSICECHCPKRAEEINGFPGAGVMGVWKLCCGCWQLNSWLRDWAASALNQWAPFLVSWGFVSQVCWGVWHT